MEKFSKQEIERMKKYEKRTGEKIIYSFEERCAIYRKADKTALQGTLAGIVNAIVFRTSLDNDDCFDGPDDSWKLKALQENRRAIEKVLNE